MIDLEYIFRHLITTELVQSKLAHILISTTTNIINMHIVTLLCVLLYTGIPYLDFIIQIMVSVIMALEIEYTYGAVQRYFPEFYAVTQYLINNYSIDNYRVWKRRVVLLGCGYACVVLYLVELNNQILYVYILQYAICYAIVEQIEQRSIQQFVAKLNSEPISKVHTSVGDALINSYLSTRTQIIDNSVSGSITAGPISRRRIAEKRKI